MYARSSEFSVIRLLSKESLSRVAAHQETAKGFCLRGILKALLSAQLPFSAMLSLNYRAGLVALALAAALPAFAAKPYEAMDYGRFLSATFNSAQGQNTLTNAPGSANKGIAIRLGKEGSATMLFDTDLLRMASGWTGGFFKPVGVAFQGAHGPNPQPAEGAQVVFTTTSATPGWSSGGKLEDPRKLPTGPGAAKVPFGPLPKEWAKFKGLYLNGDHVVLAYTVGAAPVLESPDLEKAGEMEFLTRTVNVLAKGAATSLVLADLADSAKVEVKGNAVIISDDPKKPESRLLIAASALPPGAKLEQAQSHIVLKLDAPAGGEAFKVAYWKGAEADLSKALDAPAKLAKPAKLVDWTKGGPAHWTADITTAGVLGEAKDAPYVVDTLTLPNDNPYKSWMRTAALDFFHDGTMAVSTWSGDVWIVKGIDEKLGKLSWHRFATGLHQPLGLKIVDEQIYVLGRDQITRLYDLNNDGEADLYECFNNDVQVTPGFHEFAFDLQTDLQGNFYFSKGGPVNPGGRGWGPLSDHNGCLFKVAKDGSKLEVFATGVRAPNGIGVSPEGQVSVGDNQGTWVPVDYIHFPKQGEFIGVVDLAHKPQPPDRYPPHLCWVPYDMDNSCGGHTWVTSDKWGPLKGEMLYLSYGKSSLFRVLKEKVGDTLQGGVVKFPLKFDTGVMRARFSPKDGQLYLCGLKGWQTNGAKDGAIHRVRYTGQPLTMPSTLRITDKGIHIGFTAPLEAASAGDADNYAIQQYNYQWTSNYGSPEFKVSDPKLKGRDTVEVKSAKLSDDRKSVFLEVPGLAPVMQMRIKMNLKSEAGADVSTEIGNTINVVGKE